MDERNTRPVRVSSSRAVRPAAGSRATQTSRNSRQPARKPAGGKKKFVFNAQTALILAVAAVLVICVPLMIVTLSASSSAAEEDAAAENVLGIETVAAQPTGEEDALLQGPLTEDPVEGGDGENTEDPDTATGNSTATYQKGDSGAEVARMQARLMALGYMTKDETTDYFGSATESALKLFQKVYGFEQNGAASPEVRERLFKESTPFFTLEEGSKNDAVLQLQKRLTELKYLTAEATGYFGEETGKAVKAFQEKNHLTVDGKVGLKTWNRLNSSDAIRKDAAEATKAPEGTNN